MYLIDLEPQTSPRPRVTSRGTFMSKEYKKYKADMMFLIKQLHIPKGDYSELTVYAHFTYPKSTPKKNLIDDAKMRVKPDFDNVVKAISDCLEELGILENDSQLSDGICRKRYTLRNRGYIKFELTV